MKYGFEWGPAQIVRACTHGTDRVLLIETPKQRLQVRITKTGLLRLDEGGPIKIVRVSLVKEK